MLQNPHRHRSEGCRVASKTGAGPLGATKLAQHHSPSTKSAAQPGHGAREQRGAAIARQLARGLRQGRHYSPNNNRAGPLRYKTLPAHPPSRHFRYKTLLAHPKWLNLALFLHAGRVLYRSHHQEAEQGEFCTEHEAESGLATTPPQAPLVRRALEGLEGLEGTGGLRGAGTSHGTGRRRQDPSQTNFACNSIGPKFNKPRKRCNSNDANSMFEQAAGELHAKLLCRRARPRCRQAPAGSG